MDLGILERIESKLDILLNQKSSPSTPSTPSLTVVPKTETPQTPETPEAPQGSGLFDDLGFEWDERIHSQKKGKTAAGLWKKVRGCDKELYDKIMAEQAPQDKTETVEVPSPETTAPPPPPAKKNKTAPPPPPPSIDPIEEEKKKAMDAISSLTTSCGVPFDNVLAQLPEGVANFDSLPKEQYKEFGLKMKTWVDWLGMIHDENLKIQEMGGQAGIDGMLTVYGFYNKSTHANQISPENLPTVYDSLKEYREKWEAIQ